PTAPPRPSCSGRRIRRSTAPRRRDETGSSTTPRSRHPRRGRTRSHPRRTRSHPRRTRSHPRRTRSHPRRTRSHPRRVRASFRAARSEPAGLLVPGGGELHALEELHGGLPGELLADAVAVAHPLVEELVALVA